MTLLLAIPTAEYRLELHSSRCLKTGVALCVVLVKMYLKKNKLLDIEEIA